MRFYEQHDDTGNPMRDNVYQFVNNKRALIVLLQFVHL